METFLLAGWKVFDLRRTVDSYEVTNTLLLGVELEAGFRLVRPGHNKITTASIY